jgi:4-carboxymuconolactone decarboxylase
MRFVLLMMVALSTWAQTPPDLKALGLDGGRFPAQSWEQLTPAQQTMIQHVLAGPRGNLGGPFNVLLRSPETGDQIQSFGASMRFLTSMPAKLRELAIIITARHWTSHFEWYAHAPAARQAGLDEAIVQAIAEGKRPAKMSPEETTVYNFATELLAKKQVSDPTFAAAKQQLGEKGVVDLTALMGYYQLVSMLLNVDLHPLPDGAKSELKPLP